MRFPLMGYTEVVVGLVSSSGHMASNASLGNFWLSPAIGKRLCGNLRQRVGTGWIKLANMYHLFPLGKQTLYTIYMLYMQIKLKPNFQLMRG